MSTITVVDDNRQLLTSVELLLKGEGYEVRVFTDARAGLQDIETQPPDLAILDIKMPRLDGMSMLQRIRRGSNLPVMFLTSKDADADEESGLEKGADDYVKKPVRNQVLLARVRALLRRTGPAPEATVDPRPLVRGKLMMDDARHQCLWDGKPVNLTVTEFKILKHLAEHPNFIKSRARLMECAYGDHKDQAYERTIDSHIKRIRRKFREVDPKFSGIRTLYASGYSFEEV